MKRDQNKNTRPAYDFSKGVRGKYVERLGGPHGDWVREMAARDAQRWIAESLRRFQSLEGTFVAYFVLLRDQSIAEAGHAAWEAIENPQSAAHVSLLNDLRSERGRSTELATELSKLLIERNWLVHRSLHSARLEIEPGEFVDRVTESATAASEIESEFRSFLLRRCESLGIALQEAEDRAAQVIHQWAAA